MEGCVESLEYGMVKDILVDWGSESGCFRPCFSQVK
jgi:hypothetical protein